MPDDLTTLEELLRADLPPARELLLQIAVVARCERQRFRRQVAKALAVGIAVTTLVLLGAAAISAWLAQDVTRLAGALVVAVAAIAAWIPPGSGTFRGLVGARWGGTGP